MGLDKFLEKSEKFLGILDKFLETLDKYLEELDDFNVKWVRWRGIRLKTTRHPAHLRRYLSNATWNLSDI